MLDVGVAEHVIHRHAGVLEAPADVPFPDTVLAGRNAVDAVAQVDDARGVRVPHRRDEAIEQDGSSTARQDIPVRAAVDIGDDADPDPVYGGATELGGIGGANPAR
jgi:hypothetical protein